MAKHGGEGWHVENSTVSFGVRPPPPNLITYVFEGWEGDESTPALNSSLLMNRPKKIVAKWYKDHTRLIIISLFASAAFNTMFLYYKYKRGSTKLVDKQRK